MLLSFALPLLLQLALTTLVLHPAAQLANAAQASTASAPSAPASPASSLLSASPTPSVLPSSLPPLSLLPPQRNLTELLPLPANSTLSSSGSASSSSSSSSFSLFGSGPYTGEYSSRLSVMSASLPSLWRLELQLPASVASSTSLVEAHLLLERDADQSFVQPAATTAANGVVSSVGSAVYTPITNAQQLAPLFPASNVAINYSRTASASETILAALFSASPTTSVQLNYVMRQQPDAGHFSLDCIAFQPQSNQSLWSAQHRPAQPQHAMQRVTIVWASAEHTPHSPSLALCRPCAGCPQVLLHHSLGCGRAGHQLGSHHGGRRRRVAPHLTGGRAGGPE